LVSSFLFLPSHPLTYIGTALNGLSGRHLEHKVTQTAEYNRGENT
jgi:hypothetical protein